MTKTLLQNLLSSQQFRAVRSFLRSAAGEKNYFLLLSIVAGLVSGLAAVMLKAMAHWISSATGSWGLNPYLVPLLPGAGILFCILFVRLFVKGTYEKSLAGVIESAANGTASIPVQKTYSHILTSGVSVGLGVSAGLEAPIALTGSAIGANLGRLFRLGREGRTLLLACGGAAGVSAVFNSPVAGALFACEILLPEFSVPALIPMLIASAAAAVVSEVIYPGSTFTITVSDWAVQDLPYYILLGLAAGLVSAYVIRSSIVVGKRFSLIRNVWVRGLIGCAVAYCVFLVLPMMRGEGYGFVNLLVQGHESEILEGSPAAFLFRNPWSLLFLAGFLVFAKAAVSSACLATGGDGGIFAPSMFTGAFLGFFMARLIRMLGLYGCGHVNETNFIAIGMGGVLAGVMHAPMTGIFLIAEITGGYKLFIPLMIVASLSCFLCRLLTRYNVYKSIIAERGGTPDQSRAAAELGQENVLQLVEHNFETVHPDDTLRKLLTAVMRSKRNIFPVVSDEGILVGIVTLDNIRPFLLDEQLYDVALVFDIMSDAGPALDVTDSVEKATTIFERSRAWNLPVLRDGKYVGFVSRAGVFDRYRGALRNKRELF